MTAKKKSKKKKSNRAKRLLSLIFLSVIIILAAITVLYFSWKNKLEENSIEYTHEIETSSGKVSYAVMGEGPVVLVIHREGTGLSSISKYSDIAEAGYKVVVPSRPGYPGTSIELGRTYAEQSGLLVSFLDAMDINSPVFIIAESLSGPLALTFCYNYPGRVKALVTFDALVSPLKDANGFRERSMISYNSNPMPGSLNNFITYYNSVVFGARSFQKILLKQTLLGELDSEKLAVNTMTNDDDKLKFMNYLKSSMPTKNRKEGLLNDIKQAETYKPVDLMKITTPVFVFQTEIGRLISLSEGHKLAKGVLKGIEYTYRGAGPYYWLGREWQNIKTRLFSFFQVQMSESNKQDGLFGTWISMEDGTMLTITEDGKFNVEFPSVERKKKWNGHFTIEDDRILFYFKENDMICKTQLGEYAFKLPESNLILIEKKDRCKTRKNKMAGNWFRL